MMQLHPSEVATKFCITHTETVKPLEIEKLQKLGFRADDLFSEKNKREDRNPKSEETGYVGMTTRFGIRVVGISLRLDYIQDASVEKPKEIRLDFADFEPVKSPPLKIINTLKDDRWDPSAIYRLEVKGLEHKNQWFWERTQEMDIKDEPEAVDLVNYFRESSIEIEVFNSASEMRWGSFKLPLRYFLKKGEKFMRRGLKCELTDNARQYVIGEIFIVMTNE
jgi:hypothetical protein